MSKGNSSRQHQFKQTEGTIMTRNPTAFNTNTNWGSANVLSPASRSNSAFI